MLVPRQAYSSLLRYKSSLIRLSLLASAMHAPGRVFCGARQTTEWALGESGLTRSSFVNLMQVRFVIALLLCPSPLHPRQLSPP